MDLLDRLLGHDSWTTRRLLALSETLNDEQLDREFDIGHLSVRRTFEHIIWNVECWTDLMQGRPVRSRSRETQSIAALSRRFESAAGEFHTIAREVVNSNRLDDRYVDRLDDPPREKTYGATILHVATHGMHHRAQLLFMLRRLGVSDLPEGDALSWEMEVRSNASS